MKLNKLYSRTSKGQVQEWTIEVIDNTYVTHEGICDGKITTSKPTVCKAKNTGKANETTDNEQALLEAEAKFKKKIASGYFESLALIDTETFYEPMLAHKYGDHEFAFPCAAQPKLDGQRCICKKNGMWSRNGKPILSAPHIREALEPLFLINPNLIFDGELYCNKLKDDFNKIISLTKKTKPTEADLKESKDVIQYWIYDLPSSGKNGFKQRSVELQGLLSSDKYKWTVGGVPSCLVYVPTDFVNGQTQLDDHFGRCITLGYEGQIIRTENGLYENKRSKNLLKRKEFDDSEFELLDVLEGDGNRSGMAGYAIIKLPNGKTCKSNIKGTHEWLTELLKNVDDIRGKQVTVRHFKLTPDGIPRFPYIVAIRDYE